MSQKKNTFSQHKLALIGIFLAPIISQLAVGEPHHWAENVCNVSVPVKKDLIVEHPVEYEIKVQSMCGLLPCVKTRTETRTDQTIKTVVQHINKITCCPGFAETLNRRCSPICSDPCGPGGKCIAPNVCKCHSEPSQSAPGFTGATCRRFVCLANNRWGASCERECQSECKGNSYCSADTGKCVCNPGWHGPNCSLECGPDESAESGCSFISQMQPVIEPDANLLATDNNLVLARAQKAEALVLENMVDDGDVKIMSSTDNNSTWVGLASSYLLGSLSVMSLILLVAFLIVKKRYDFVRNELYYASVTSVATSSTGRGSAGGSPASNYSASTYYTAPSSMSPTGKNLQENLSFAAATRNILSGVISNSGGKKMLAISPETESHLIRSQKASQQNIYSEIDIASRSRAQTPVIARRTEDDDEHIYQVPKKTPQSMMNLSTDSFVRPSDVSVSMGYDDDSNIYEEIKPRNGGESGNS